MLVKDFVEASGNESDVRFRLITNDGWVNEDLNKDSALSKVEFMRAKVDSWRVTRTDDGFGMTVNIWGDISMDA